MKELQAELADLRDSYESTQASLEAETLSKVDLQNKCQSLKEELVFNKKLYEEVGFLHSAAPLSATSSGFVISLTLTHMRGLVFLSF